MPRQPAVAGRFYPASSGSLRQTIDKLLPVKPVHKKNALALICPHAGYIYSGALACKTIASAVIPERVLILGPNHHGLGSPVALSSSDWNMPMGTVPADKEMISSLVASSPLFREDEQAHRNEHSLEVQVPFLQICQEQLKIVPIALSQLSFEDCETVAEVIADVINQSATPSLLLASTDMSHYESRSSATKKDTYALEKITDLDPFGLYQTVLKNRISMCGFIPVTITLLAAKKLGATAADLIGYTDSGETSGDTDQVVGYAGFVIS